jgi:hypothetical protein
MQITYNIKVTKVAFSARFPQAFFEFDGRIWMKIFPLTIYVLLKPFIQILPSD